MQYEITEKYEYIELIKLLKLTGIAETGGEAKYLVDNQQVFFNEVVEKKKRRKLRKGDQIKVAGIKIDLI